MSSSILIAVLSITVYIVLTSFINTYMFSKAKKSLLLVFYTAVASSMLFFAIAKLLETVAPTADIKTMYKNVQYILSVFFIIGLVCFFLSLFHKKILLLRGMIFASVGLFLVHLLLLLVFFQNSLLHSVFIMLILFLGINFTIFLFRYRIFPEIEISLDSIVENVKERVVVFDLHGNLVDRNLLGLDEASIFYQTATLKEFIEKINSYSKIIVLEHDKIALLENDYQTEVCILWQSITRYYIFHANAIKNRKYNKLGTVCTLRDITENKMLSIELDHKNKQLQDLNKELEDYIHIADSLEEEKERTHITKEINSTIGQKMTEILSVLEVIKIISKEDANAFEKPLNEAIKSCRDVLSEVRIVVSKLIPDKKKGVK